MHQILHHLFLQVPSLFSAKKHLCETTATGTSYCGKYHGKVVLIYYRPMFYLLNLKITLLANISSN